MIVCDYLKLIELKKLIKAGIISTSVHTQFMIYCKYDSYKQAGVKTIDAALWTSMDFACSESQVYKVNRIMSKEL